MSDMFLSLSTGRRIESASAVRHGILVKKDAKISISSRMGRNIQLITDLLPI